MKHTYIVLFLSLFLVFAFSAQAQQFERGLAEMIEDSQNTKKLLALHRTIPTGTSVKVVNPANGRSTVVRVVGKLPATGLNQKVVIKISKEAYTSLNASGKRFGVEIFPLPKEVKLIHIVESGETLYSIAKKYKVAVESIKEWNDLEDESLSLGQKLTIKKQ